MRADYRPCSRTSATAPSQHSSGGWSYGHERRQRHHHRRAYAAPEPPSLDHIDNRLSTHVAALRCATVSCSGLLRSLHCVARRRLPRPPASFPIPSGASRARKWGSTAGKSATRRCSRTERGFRRPHDSAAFGGGVRFYTLSPEARRASADRLRDLLRGSRYSEQSAASPYPHLASTATPRHSSRSASSRLIPVSSASSATRSTPSRRSPGAPTRHRPGAISRGCGSSVAAGRLRRNFRESQEHDRSTSPSSCASQLPWRVFLDAQLTSACGLERRSPGGCPGYPRESFTAAAPTPRAPAALRSPSRA